MISQIEKGLFAQLFNRCGYVLDFSTADFDSFTLSSIGVQLCSKYHLSKGKSLMAYIAEAPESNVIKLFADLMLHYETSVYAFENETASGGAYERIYKQCKKILEREQGANVLVEVTKENLAKRFSNDYISQELEQMLKLQHDNPTDAIGKAKELVESCCKTILLDNGIAIDTKWNLNQLLDETLRFIRITPKQIPDNIPDAKAIKAILGNLKAILQNLAELRNNYGTGHGKDSRYVGLQERHAQLAVGTSMTIVRFIWDSYEDRINR